MALPLPSTSPRRVAWQRLIVKGSPGHGSLPHEVDNALIKAAEVIRRLADYRPTPRIHDLWEVQAANLPYDDDLKKMLLDPGRLDDAIAQIPNRGKARHLHACTHTTFSPNVAAGGIKTNVIPDEVTVEVEPIHDSPSTASDTDNPMWDVLEGIMTEAQPGSIIQPSLIVGGADARFFRAAGSVAYGAGLFSPAVTYEVFPERFHGRNERIDVESLALGTQLWIEASKQMLGA